MEYREFEGSKIHIIKMSQGEDLLEQMQEVAQQLNLCHAIVLCGVGSVSSYHVHAIKTTMIPPGNVFYQEDGPFDIASIQGYIIDYKPHLHIALANEGKIAAGHLEKGTIVHTFCAVAVLSSDKSDLSGLDDFKGRKK